MEPSLALDRPGLDRRTRSLLLAMAAIAPADWPRLQLAIAAARDHCSRSDLEETLLQATLFYGFPRTVSAFEQLEQIWPSTSPPAGGDVPAEERARRGRDLFQAIYGRNDAAVRARLAAFHREFHDFVLEAAYGRILCRPGLDTRLRELLAVTALAALDQLPQLIAHARGALAFGADATSIREAIWCSGADDARTEGLMRRI